MKTCAVALAWSAAIAAAADDNPAETLKRVTAKVLARGGALPNYTCVETVTREYYQSVSAAAPKACIAAAAASKDSSAGLPVPPPLMWTVTDRLRLDVTISHNGEIYSWVGASKFEDGTIDEIVKQGPIGTGAFGALLAVVFKQDPKTFRFSRYLLDEGRSLMEYSFEVSQENSHYHIKRGDAWEATAYTGTLQADPQSDDVVRIAPETAEAPRPGSDSCRTSTTMQFSLTRIGNGEFPLPKSATQRFVNRTGEEVENIVSLANCREYVGESTISFSDDSKPAAGDGQNAAVSAPIQLPSGLPFTLELTTPISTDTGAAGDSFAGRLVNALRDKGGKTLAPAHALVEGRVVLIEMRHTNPAGAVLVLKPMTVEIAGVKVPLAAARKTVGKTTGKTAIQLPQLWEGNTGIFPLAGEHAVLKSDFQSDWVTAAPGGAGEKSR